jgi:PPP family 3-phenylpropionic acid transporter
MWRLLRQPAFLAFLIAGTIHWASCSPSFILLTIHFGDLGIDPVYAGAAFFLGVAAEVAMMWNYRHVERRLSLYPLMGLTFALTSLRWFVMARVEDGPTLAAIQVLHGFTFGAFYVSVISYLDETVPPALRATGRALFTSVSIGVGGLIGHQMAGLTYDLGQKYDIGGGKLAFHIAAGIEWLAPVALYLSYKWRPQKPVNAGRNGTTPEPNNNEAGE